MGEKRLSNKNLGKYLFTIIFILASILRGVKIMLDKNDRQYYRNLSEQLGKVEYFVFVIDNEFKTKNLYLISKVPKSSEENDFLLILKVHSPPPVLLKNI